MAILSGLVKMGLNAQKQNYDFQNLMQQSSNRMTEMSYAANLAQQQAKAMPSAQMEGLKNAGINPMLAMGNAGQGPSSSAVGPSGGQAKPLRSATDKLYNTAAGILKNDLLHDKNKVNTAKRILNIL